MGIRAGRGIKDMKEYALANRSFGTGALVLSFLATNLAGASVFNGISYMFSQGIIIVLALAGLIISFLVTGFFITPRIIKFDNCFTMGDLMEKFYDKKSKIIAGILGTLTAISLAGMELVLLGFMGENLLNIKAEWTITIGGLLLAAYSAHGGIKSVTATDIFQFFIFIVVFPAVVFIMLNKAGGFQEVFTHVPKDMFRVFDHPNFAFYLTMFLMWSIFPVGMIDPALIQRMLMIRNQKQARNQYLVIAAFDPIFQAMLLVISFSALILYPHIEGKQVVPHIIQTLLPVGIKGLAMTSLLAIGMSSIDSFLHAAGLTCMHDVIKPFIKDKDMDEVRWTRYTTIAISIIAIVIALYTDNTFELLLDSFAFAGPVLMFPLLSGIVGLKTDTRSFYGAMAITLIAFVICKFHIFVEQSHYTTLFSIIVNGISFFTIHTFKNKGIAIVNRAQGKDIIQIL
jgi:SSS family solute:Na+ symporter